MTLNWQLVTKHIRPHGQLQDKLRQKIRKLEAHLEHFPTDAVLLQVNLARHPKKLWFTASLTLHLPSNILRAEKYGPDPVPAFDLAVKAVLRELAVLKSALRREDQWKRAPRRSGLPERAFPGLPAYTQARTVAAVA
jgi:ribosome-associated translation inhibitor RaiA